MIDSETDRELLRVLSSGAWESIEQAQQHLYLLTQNLLRGWRADGEHNWELSRQIDFLQSDLWQMQKQMQTHIQEQQRCFSSASLDEESDSSASCPSTNNYFGPETFEELATAAVDGSLVHLNQLGSLSRDGSLILNAPGSSPNPPEQRQMQGDGQQLVFSEQQSVAEQELQSVNPLQFIGSNLILLSLALAFVRTAARAIRELQQPQGHPQ